MDVAGNQHGDVTRAGDGSGIDLRLAPVWAVAACSLAAGMIHAAAAGSHGEDPQLAQMFAACAVAQVGWAAVVALRPGRLLLWLGAALNVGCFAFWFASRTIGIGFVDGLVEPETVGGQDLAAAVLALLSAAGAVFLALRGWERTVSLTALRERAVAFGAAGALALLVAIPAMAAPHSHDHVDDAGSAGAATVAAGAAGGDAHTHADGHTHDGATAAADGTSAVGGQTAVRMFHNIELPAGVTDEQVARAEQLIADTRAAIAEKYATTDAAVAAGYKSIADAITGHEHFVHRDYLKDGVELDPDRIESLVYKVGPDGTKTLESGMYILTNGKTMADVPDVGGALTVWHDHQDLCFDDEGRVAGLFRGGRCVPGGTLRPTSPMLHVWVTENPCGPFAGIEGGVSSHGSGCNHDHGAAPDAQSAQGD